MYFLIVGVEPRVRHNISREAIEAQYQDLISKGKVKIFSIDSEQIEQLVENLDDNDKETLDWEEIRHEY